MQKHDRLKILRILNGLSQEALANRTDLKQASLANYERGAYGIPESSILKLSDALSVDPAYLSFGYPKLSKKIWRPLSASKGLHKDLSSLLPDFLAENELTEFRTRKYFNGYITMMSGGHDQYCLLITADQNWKTICTTLYQSDSTCAEGVVANTIHYNVINKPISHYSPEHFGYNLPADYFEFTHELGRGLQSDDVQKTIDMIVDEALPYLFRSILKMSAGNKSISLDLLDASLVGFKSNVIDAVGSILSTGKHTASAASLQSEINETLNNAFKSIHNTLQPVKKIKK